MFGVYVSNTYSVAVTGTPGVGKSTICDLFKQESQVILTVRELAQQHNCLGEFSEQYQSHDIDIHTLTIRTCVFIVFDRVLLVFA